MEQEFQLLVFNRALAEFSIASNQTMQFEGIPQFQLKWYFMVMLRKARYVTWAIQNT